MGVVAEVEGVNGNLHVIIVFLKGTQHQGDHGVQLIELNIKVHS